MIASAGPYPTFFEGLPDQGPIMSGLLLLLLAVFILGIYRLWRTSAPTFSSVLVIGAPTLIGCCLAAFQSFAAQGIVRGNEVGLVYLSHPERYIGHLRIYLIIGIAMSACLLGVAFISHRRSPNPK